MSKIVTVGVVLAAALTLVGCEKVEDAGRKVARKTGSVVGKGATEFFSGVGDGQAPVGVRRGEEQVESREDPR